MTKVLCTQVDDSADVECKSTELDLQKELIMNGSHLILSNRQIETATLQRSFLAILCPSFLGSVQVLDLSRNCLDSLPVELCNLPSLKALDISRNRLRGLPSEIIKLQSLVTLSALSNHFRWRQLPLHELASLPNLECVDFRYNNKLSKKIAREQLELFLSKEKIDLRLTKTITDDRESGENSWYSKLSACDRDPEELRSQLEPLSTPQLRKRLHRTFGVEYEVNDETAYNRETIMQRLLSCYDAMGGRSVRYERGIPLRSDTIASLLLEMESIRWPQTTRERPKISAEKYMILQRPGSEKESSNMSRNQAANFAKVQRYHKIWERALEVMESVDPEFASRYSALAVTKNFRGSPHIDTLNVGPFYALSLGDFTPLDGGKVCVECSPTVVAEVDTRGKMAKIDGRFPHWVSPYDDGGTRYSLIYYVTTGEVIPQTTAIFEPQALLDDGEIAWVPPPSFVP